MYNYYFVDNATGEEFIVQEENRSKAYEIAQDNFEQPIMINTISDYEAECLGLDTY